MGPLRRRLRFTMSSASRTASTTQHKCVHCSNTEMLCKASIERKNREVEAIHLENMRLRATLGNRDKEIKSLRDATLDAESRNQLEAKDREIARLAALVKKLQGGRPMLHRRVPSSASHLSDNTDKSWVDENGFGCDNRSESWSEVGSELDENLSEPGPRTPTKASGEPEKNAMTDSHDSLIEERMLVPQDVNAS